MDIPWDAIWAFLLDKPLKVAVIVIVAVLVRVALTFVIRRTVDRVVSGVKKKQNVEDTQQLLSSPLAAVRTVQRTRTLGTVLSNLVTAIVAIVSVILVVTTVDASAAGAFSLITAALGAGLGFGAQNIVKDILNGLFIVIEDQLGVGDVVDTGFATGVVESVGIRVTQVRDVNGTLWYVRNGEMLRVGNLSQGWSRVILDMAIPYEEDVDAVEARLLATAVEMQQEPKWKRLFLEKPEIWGIESISSEAVVVRLVAKTRSGSKDDVARELRGRLKRTLDELEVRTPALSTITLQGIEGAASVRGARPPKTAPLPTQPAAEQPAAKKPPRSSD
ncbi:mechanosensitive ion channel family protein [Homoserinibacter sp. YIM 151385]|uniref:mechanosensitive ion channel family protein n=1 Tax=Homoserinibacter sp. YIM 151385 TaxID=2985506 RepID=UPI0022F0B0B8|nr:mechanosensitive ion channel domain-containing protein [Homoserinibacter sp. YIM 151385]WBU39036.1 mechanosensitive ion channel [Homoserinibacter sp. YIM 151385]